MQILDDVKCGLLVGYIIWWWELYNIEWWIMNCWVFTWKFMHS